jgi:hypothetical protein
MFMSNREDRTTKRLEKRGRKKIIEEQRKKIIMKQSITASKEMQESKFIPLVYEIYITPFKNYLIQDAV